MIKIADYLNVRDRALTLGCAVPEGLAILPDNFVSAKARTDLLQLSEAATVRSLFRSHNIPLKELLSTSERPGYIHNNSFGWMAPTLFIASSLWTENPDAVAVALNVLSAYITDFFKGLPRANKTVKLDLVIERQGDRSCRKLSYEGDPGGLADLLPTIRKLSND